MKSLEDLIRRILRIWDQPEDGELGSHGTIGDLVNTDWNEDNGSEHKRKQFIKRKNALLVISNNADKLSIWDILIKS